MAIVVSMAFLPYSVGLLTVSTSRRRGGHRPIHDPQRGGFNVTTERGSSTRRAAFPLVRPLGRRELVGRGAGAPRQEPGIQLSRAFHLENAALLEQKRLTQPPPRALRNLDASGHAVRFHP